VWLRRDEVIGDGEDLPWLANRESPSLDLDEGSGPREVMEEVSINV
jgi:hypothetical protein